MADLSGNLVRIRRFLRDHDGIVWSDDDILQHWNNAQLEICQKAKFLERVETSYYPPEYNWSYLFPWENLKTYPFLEGDIYRALTEFHQTEFVLCYPWEGTYWSSLSDAPDDGYRFIHPWEGAVSSTPADVVPLKMHTRMQRMKYISYDEEPLTEIQPREVANDSHYKTRRGQPTNYYFVDETENLYCLYPHPSSVTWQTTTEGDVFDDAGGMVFDFGFLYPSDTGLVTDVVSTEDAVFMVYDAIPYEMTAWGDDDCDIPDVFRKYVEYSTLERCFGADSDGFIPTLRDYWKMRKEAGIEAIKRMMRMRAKDRDYQFGGSRPARRVRGGSLGSHYPSV